MATGGQTTTGGWDESNTLVSWFRGTYSSAQSYDEEVVGIITQEE